MRKKINRDTIYMKYPSSWWHDLWREGLASGNGFLGANVYGGTKKEVVLLKSHDLWHGGWAEALPDVSGAFARQREKMDAGAFAEANGILADALRDKDYHAKLESMLPLADLGITYGGGGGFSDYTRFIRMDTGEVGCRWKEELMRVDSRLFVSRADRMLVKRVSCAGGTLDLTLTLDMHPETKQRAGRCAHIQESRQVRVCAPCIIYTALNDDGKAFGAVAYLRSAGENCVQKGDALFAGRCTQATVFVKVFTNTDPARLGCVTDRIRSELTRCDKDYDYYLKRHAALHTPLYRSAGLELDYAGGKSNEELLLAAYAGSPSAELIEKLWRYGRYLFISGTDPDANPFNMYGLWGGDYGLMWGHNMANINIQMIYWHTFTGNLADFGRSFIRYYNSHLDTFRGNAKQLYGLDGIFVPAGTTPHMARPAQVVPVILNWVSAGGWLASHYYWYYRHTGDRKCLREDILPFMEAVAAFYEGFLTYTQEGRIRFYPSVSPENTPGNYLPKDGAQMAHPMTTTINSTMDLAILKEFFTHLCALAREEGLYADRIETWERILAAIPAYKVSNDGGIREWQDDHFTERYDHRHLSHMYPLFPGHEAGSADGRELLPAFLRAAKLRKIDSQTGWSMAFLACVYARLGDGEAAMDQLVNLTKSTLLSNFFTLHNDWRGMNISLDWDPSPVQLDASMGIVNAVQEMLLYTSDSLIRLLPALPALMCRGRVTSFCYPNGTVDMEWDRGKGWLRCKIRAKRAHRIRILLPKWARVRQEIRMDVTDGSVSWQEEELLAVFGEAGRLKIEIP